MKKLLLIVCIIQLALLAGCKSTELTAEKQAKTDSYIAMIEGQNFTFRATNAQPVSGKSRYLTSSYEMKISKDTIEAYLPYFGRAYSAPINSADGGIKFTSTDFNYETVQKDNGVYEIKITPKDVTKFELRGLELSLSAGTSGYGSLSVRMTNRQPISFYGTVDKR